MTRAVTCGQWSTSTQWDRLRSLDTVAEVGKLSICQTQQATAYTKMSRPTNI